MTVETVIALATGPAGAIVILLLGFLAFIRAMTTGVFVPGRFYDAAMEDRNYWRDAFYQLLANNKQSIETIEKTLPAARTPRGRPGSERTSRDLGGKPPHARVLSSWGARAHAGLVLANGRARAQA